MHPYGSQPMQMNGSQPMQSYGSQPMQMNGSQPVGVMHVSGSSEVEKLQQELEREVRAVVGWFVRVGWETTGTQFRNEGQELKRELCAVVGLWLPACLARASLVGKHSTTLLWNSPPSHSASRCRGPRFHPPA